MAVPFPLLSIPNVYPSIRPKTIEQSIFEFVDMSSPSKANALGDIRLAHLKEASEKRDVAALMSWYSKDATFTNVGTSTVR